MFKRFSTLFALLFALSVASSWAQTFTYNTGTTWNAAGTWTAAMGAMGYPGLVANVGDVSVNTSVNFTDTPASAISSLTIGGTSNVGIGAGTLTITNFLNVPAGTTLTIPAGSTVQVGNPITGAGTSTIGGTIVLSGATSRIIFNGPVVQTGTGVIDAGNAGATVQLGGGVTSISGSLFGDVGATIGLANYFDGTIQTGGALALTSSLFLDANGTINLVGTTTLNAGVELTTINTAAAAIAGAGNLQGAGANSVVDFVGGPTAIQGTWFANPFNGTIKTRGNPAAASTLSGTLTIGATGVLALHEQLNPAGAGTNLILNNTVANSLRSGVTNGRINITNQLSVTLGPGFNGGTLDGARFVTSVTGTLNTGGNLNATHTTATTILQFDNTNGIFNITGTLTIAAGKLMYINNNAAGVLPGSGTFAATDNTSILRLGTGVNGGNISGNIFSNPWNGRLQTDAAIELGTTLGAVGASVLNAGPNSIFDLGGILTVNDSLALNCTQSETAALLGAAANRIIARTGGPSTAAPGPGGRVTIGPNTFAGFLPAARLGTGTNWQTGNLFIAGSSALGSTNYQIDNGSFLFLATGSVLQIASGRTLTIDGRMLGAGRINGQDNTAVLVLAATNFRNNANTQDIPGANLGNPTFDGDLRISQARTLSGSLTMGANSIYTTGGFTTTVNTPDVLTMNQTAAAGLVGAGTFVGTGTLTFGNNALGAAFPTANVPSGAAPANFGGRIILGDGVNFAAAYTVLNSTLLQLNGNTQVNAGITLQFTNTAANTLSGAGRLTAQTATSVVQFNAGANAGTVPGANIASAFVGQVITAGAMTLTGNLSMGATSVLNLGGNLTISPASQVTLAMSAAPGTSLPGAGLLVGQPNTTNIPEIVLASGALSGQLPTGTGDITTGAAAAEFGGRLSVGSGYAVSANTTIAQPAILSITNGTQLIVNSGRTLNLNTTSTPATGPGTGVIQAQDQTAIVSLVSGFNGATLPGALFAAPFAGQLIIPSTNLSQNGNLTMGISSILLLNGNLNVNPGSTLLLTGGTNSLQGTGRLDGSNRTGVVSLGLNSTMPVVGFNNGVIPAARFAAPFNGGLTTATAMVVSGQMEFGAPSSLEIRGDLTLPAGVTTTFRMTGVRSIFGTGRFVAGSATSVATLGTSCNADSIPGTSFTNFGGIVSLSSPMTLGSTMTLGATGVLDLAGAQNRLTLGTGSFSLSVANPIRSTSATAFIITNGTGGLTINNSALTSYFFPIGTSATNYTPLTLSNAGTADVFTVRARPGITTLPANYPNFVDTEWLITQAGANASTLRLAPQWSSANQRGTAYNANGVALGLLTGAAYVESATGGTITLASGLSSFNGTFTAVFNNTALIAFSKIVLPPPTVVQPIISGITPSTVPVSNDNFTVTFTGVNLGNLRVFTAQNLTSNAIVNGTIIGTQSPTLVTVSFPGIVRGIAGTLRINATNGTITNPVLGATTANITVTSIAAPTLVSASPATTATGRAFALNVTGTGFLSQARWSINNNAVRLLSATTATNVVLEIPASVNSTAGTVRIRVTNSDGQFAELNYVIGQAPRPDIASISPRAVFVGTNGVTINVQGSGFFGPGFVTAAMSATPVAVNVISSTRLTLTIPAGLLTTVGLANIAINNSDNQSIGYIFSILERVPLGPTPEITSYTPSTTTASGRAYSVVINGNNFNPNALITIVGTVADRVVREANRLVVEVPFNFNQTARDLDITIQNPDLQSTTAIVAVGARLAAPVINSITPMTTVGSVAPGRAFSITVSGANFNNPTVLLNGQPLPIISQSTNSIVVAVASNRPPAVNFSPLENSVVVLNGDGQATAGAILIVTTSVSVLDNTLPGFSVYPSPVSDVMTIQGGFDRPTNVVVTVTNVIGQRVMSFTEQQVSGSYNRQVNVAALPVGAYMVEITDGARRMVQKVIKY
ncbi:MAG: T9SS type A sorting domain-containing protein [Candidatus Kapaibacteriota bacterium]